MSGWGTGWGKFNTEPTEYSKEVIEKWAGETVPNSINWVLEQNDKNAVWDGPTAAIAGIPKFLNKHPTHDPYTNPHSHIYYECGCGAILDPGTKSFAALNNHASEAGWKVRWGPDSYVPYCVKCGEDVE